jgi:nicotinic acid mononucleotide adenylyltransferase
MVTTPLYDISSTEIRESVRKGQVPTEWVDEQVAEYIAAHQLYR